jgi:hypothetical protein
LVLTRGERAKLAAIKLRTIYIISPIADHEHSHGITSSLCVFLVHSQLMYLYFMYRAPEFAWDISNGKNHIMMSINQDKCWGELKLPFNKGLFPTSPNKR